MLENAESLSLGPINRRRLLTQGAGAIFFTSASGSCRAAGVVPAQANGDELPSFLRDYTALAPLGRGGIDHQKTTGLSMSNLAERLSNDLTEGSSGQGGYFLTGDLSLDIFRDDCIFEDPTNRVASLTKYRNALRILFDPSQSAVQLLPPGLIVDESSGTISGRLRSRGYLQLPWKPYVTAYETTIVYTVGDDGLIARQSQKWSKSASQALKETFTPSLTAPPPLSIRQSSPTEPPAVTQLFQYINGRRPYEYSPEENLEIQELISAIVADEDETENFRRNLLPGKWILAYIQRGPNGQTIDRRIPFPDFNFNDNFQSFTADSVVNTGQLLGPWAYVQVSGSLGEEDPATTRVPKRLHASIKGGKFCVIDDTKCLELPITGEGLFDSLYLGDRLRIGQNINGGGARIVQIRVD